MTTFAQLTSRGSLLVNDGYRTKAMELGRPGFPVLRVAEVGEGSIQPSYGDHVRSEYRDKIGYKLSQAGDVLLTTKGTVGRRAVMPELWAEFAYSPQLCFFRVLDDSIDNRWLYYWLGGSDFWRQAAGVSQQTDMAPYISLRDLRAIEIDLPSIQEQRSIAATLGALDDKIESNHRIVATALGLARANVDQAVEGTTSAPYTDAFEVRMGSAFKGDQFSEPGVGRPLLRIRDLKTFESQTWTNEARRDEIVIQPGDVVVGMDAEFRATLWLGAESVLNQRVCSFRGRPAVGRAFILAALEPQLAFQERAKSGTTVIHLNKADIDSFSVPHLSTEEHRRLSDTTETLLDLAVARATESLALRGARNALLPELLSGQLRIPAVVP